MRAAFFSACFLVTTSAAAAETRVVHGARIELGEIAANVPPAARDLDLGPAPPPGGSRLFGREELVQRLKRAGFDTSAVTLPQSVRAIGASKEASVRELAELGRTALEAVLPEGVTVQHLSARRPLELAPESVVKAPALPRMPRRAGSFRTTLVFPVAVDGEIKDRVPMSVVFQLDEQAASPDAPRGARVSLIIERNSAVISAAGTALKDTDIGEIASFRVEKTGRVVRARLEKGRVARVLEAQ